MDSLAGVGFSYSKTRSDYITRDLPSALDMQAFLLKVRDIIFVFHFENV